MSIQLETIATTAGEFEIALAELKDSEIITELLIEAAVWMNSVGVPQWNPDQFTEEEVASYFEGREVYLLSQGDEIAGFFTMQDSDPAYWESQNVVGYSYLHRLTLTPSYRGKGISSEVIYWAAKRSKLLNRLGLRLDCWTGNLKVNALYEKLGFQNLGIGHKSGRHVHLYEMDKKLYESL